MKETILFLHYKNQHTELFVESLENTSDISIEESLGVEKWKEAQESIRLR